MLTDDEIKDIAAVGIELGRENFTIRYALAIIAAYQAKLRQGVELPEDLEQEIYQRSREFVSTNVEDAIRDIAYQYAAAAAAQAREKALDEVTDLLREYDMVDSAFGRDVAELKGKQA